MNNCRHYYAQKKATIEASVDTQNFIDGDVQPESFNLSPEEAYRLKLVNKSYVVYRNLIEQAKHRVS
jgi:hypothetical protein